MAFGVVFSCLFCLVVFRSLLLLPVGCDGCGVGCFMYDLLLTDGGRCVGWCALPGGGWFCGAVWFLSIYVVGAVLRLLSRLLRCCGGLWCCGCGGVVG